MKLSAKIDYACRAVLELALHYEEKIPLQVSTIARRQGIPQKYLIQILLLLQSANLVLSRRGKEGGYLLAKSPVKVTVGEVMRVVGGPLLELVCLAEGSSLCSIEEICGLKGVWLDLKDKISQSVDTVNYQMLVEKVKKKEAIYHI